MLCDKQMNQTVEVNSMSYKPTVIPPSILEGRELQKTCNLFINATAQYSEHKRNLKPYYGYYSITTKDGRCYSSKHMVVVGEKSYIHKERMIQDFKIALRKHGYTMHDIDSFECRYSKF